MTVPPSKIASLSDGTQLSYMDSGKGTKTYVLVHGATYTKNSWDKEFLTLPNGIRAIAYSARGYDKSTPFTDADNNATSPAGQLLKQHGSDLSLFLDFVDKELGVSGPVTVIGWSQGNIVPLATAFYDFPLKNVDNVIMFEPPTTATWGLERDAAMLKVVSQPDFSFSPDVFPKLFVKYVAGYYDHPKEFFEKRSLTGEFEAEIPSSFPNDEPLILGTNDPTHLGAVFHAHFVEPKDQNAKKAAEKLGKLVSKVGVIYGDKSVPECIVGSWVAEDLFKGKTETVIIPGGNHFLQMLKPEEFWKAVEKLS